MTLGAQPSDVLRLIYGQGSRLIGIGVATGVVLAVLVTRLMRALFGISPTDPMTYVAVVIGLPGRRAPRLLDSGAARAEDRSGRSAAR